MFQLLGFEKNLVSLEIYKQKNGTVSRKHLSLQYDNTIPFGIADNEFGFLYSKEISSSSITEIVHLLNQKSTILPLNH